MLKNEEDLNETEQEKLKEVEKAVRPRVADRRKGTRTKQDLSKNTKFQEFLNQCNLTRSQIQQTKLSFLTPPSQRAKARYHNIDLLVSWGIKVLEYWNRQDFSLISTEFIIDRETLFLLRDELDQTSLNKLTKLLSIKTTDFISFSEVIMKKLGRKLWREKGKLISQAAELGLYQ